MSDVKVSKHVKPTRKQVAAEIVDMERRGMKLTEIEAITGKSMSSISQILKRAGVKHDRIAKFREDKSLILEEKQKLLLDALTEDKVATMSGKDLTISAAVLIDKQRLLDGHSASGGNISLLVIANKIHAQYQNTKGGNEQHVIEAEVVPVEQETVVEDGDYV